MPISESDYALDASDHSNLESTANSTPTSSMSKAELRKTHKPIMEKRRRAKINNCLNEIKDLILSAMKKDPERHSKLEKADILEMAVKHLKSVQKQQKDIAIRSDPNVALKYKSGYLECATEVSSFVDQLDVDGGLKQRLTKHLNNCASNIDQPQFPTFASSSLLASFAAQSRFNDDQNNNNHNSNKNNARPLATVQGIELIPSCLPNGDFAFLLPKSSFSSMLNSSSQEGETSTKRPSAFVTVTPRQITQSETVSSGILTMAKPPLSPPPSPPIVKVLKPRAEKPKMEIQHIKFPIHNHLVKKEHHEPLCIITNAGERFRQAQQVDDSRCSEENVYLGLGLAAPGGVKRKAKDDGTLAVAPSVKIARIERPDGATSAAAVATPSAFRKLTPARFSDNANAHDRDNDASEEDDSNDKNEPMWRPW